jgi:dipeptidyl aminopeptidase/acylaminoacyl peptidase
VNSVALSKITTCCYCFVTISVLKWDARTPTVGLLRSLALPTSRQEVVGVGLPSRHGFWDGPLIRVSCGVRAAYCVAAIAAVTVGQGCASTAAKAKPAGNAVTQHGAVDRALFPASEGMIVFVTLPVASGVSYPGRFSIEAIRPDGAGRRTIFSRNGRGIDCPRWSPSGRRIVFSMTGPAPFRYSNLYTVNASGTRLRQITTGRHQFDECPAWSPDGRQIAFSSDRSGNSAIWVTSLRTGRLRQVTRSTAATEDEAPAWSPDGKRIAFERCGVRRGGTCHLWVEDLATGHLRQLTSGPSPDTDPAWSPNGRRIAFDSMRGGRWNIFTMRARGGGLVEITNTKLGGVSLSPSWSPDGKWIAFEAERNGPRNIFAVRAVHHGAVKSVTHTPANGDKESEAPDWGTVSGISQV